jgi:hypothetical protein
VPIRHLNSVILSFPRFENSRNVEVAAAGFQFLELLNLTFERAAINECRGRWINRRLTVNKRLDPFFGALIRRREAHPAFAGKPFLSLNSVDSPTSLKRTFSYAVVRTHTIIAVLLSSNALYPALLGILAAAVT